MSDLSLWQTAISPYGGCPSTGKSSLIWICFVVENYYSALLSQRYADSVKPIGRAGECADSTWNNVRWYYDLRCLSLLWMEQKTGVQYEMLFIRDKNFCKMDILNGLARIHLSRTFKPTATIRDNYQISPEIIR